MCKKTIILGLALFLIGAAAFGWVFTEQRKEKQLQQKYREIIKAHLDKLDKVVAGETDVQPFADNASGENLQQELNKYKAQKETRELTFTISIACMLAGGTIFAWWILLWTARLTIKGLSVLMKFFRHWREDEDKQPTEAQVNEDERTSKQEQKSHEQQNQFKKQPEALSQKGLCTRSTSRFNMPAKNTEKTDALPCDEKSVELEEPLKSITENLNVNAKQSDSSAQNLKQTTLQNASENSLKLKGSLKTQTENLEKQVAEFQRRTQAVRQTTPEHSEPLNNTLMELSQQVAAIREYASQQQERVTKLQDGYDWNIIRTFCLKVIRCIDNLESRIEQLSKQNIETTDLKEIKDELVFALESSGVEQFEPEINSNYREHEKTTEAVKNKKPTNKSKLKGKVAKVLRQGYRYVIDVENVKIVRTAQVKLFG